MEAKMMDFMGVEENEDEQHEPQQAAKPAPPNSCDNLKKLEELTDEDVMQLTREDCRRYLKEKGMRRPSWNKGQAVQQVLSLRSLCHPTKPHQDQEAKAVLPESLSKTNEPKSGSAQLTMFYAGTVCVFENVPAEMAYAIMLLAGRVKSWNSATSTTSAVSATSASRLGVLELPQARKASLQRFLQRRRERMNLRNEVPSDRQQQQQYNKLSFTTDLKKMMLGVTPQAASEVEVTSH